MRPLKNFTMTRKEWSEKLTEFYQQLGLPTTFSEWQVDRLYKLEKKFRRYHLQECNERELSPRQEQNYEKAKAEFLNLVGHNALQQRFSEKLRIGDLQKFRPACIVNSDPRGYGLKMNDVVVRAAYKAGSAFPFTDWGGYGIFAPTLNGE